jgi:hypothetical protein
MASCFWIEFLGEKNVLSTVTRLRLKLIIFILDLTVCYVNITIQAMYV